MRTYDRVRVVSLPMHSRHEREAMEGHTGIVIPHIGKYVKVLFDNPNVWDGWNRDNTALFTENEVEPTDVEPYEFWHYYDLYDKMVKVYRCYRGKCKGTMTFVSDRNTHNAVHNRRD